MWESDAVRGTVVGTRKEDWQMRPKKQDCEELFISCQEIYLIIKGGMKRF